MDDIEEWEYEEYQPERVIRLATGQYTRKREENKRALRDLRKKYNDLLRYHKADFVGMCVPTSWEYFVDRQYYDVTTFDDESNKKGRSFLQGPVTTRIELLLTDDNPIIDRLRFGKSTQRYYISIHKGEHL